MKLKRFFFKWANPGLFFIYFRSFQTKITILQQIYVKKCPSSIRCRDSNPRPMERESIPITTRPGLPPHEVMKLKRYLTRLINCNNCRYLQKKNAHLGKILQLLSSIYLMSDFLGKIKIVYPTLASFRKKINTYQKLHLTKN